MRSWEDGAREWLKTNPPPKTFKGTPMEWAELNMPSLPALLDRFVRLICGVSR